MNLRRLLPYTTIAVVAAAAYTGWTLYLRYSAGQEAVEKVREKEAAEARKTVDRFGGGSLKILAFYVSPVSVRAGEQVLVCYSVANATEVSISPEIEPIKPSISRCVEARPSKTTVYTLKARDASGAEVRQSTSVEVR